MISLSPSYNPVSSFDAVVGQSIQVYALGLFSNGSVHDLTTSPYTTWSSSNPAVASVASGLVTPLAGGSSAISASISLKPPGVHLVGCGACPGPAPYRAQATANAKTAGYVFMYSNTPSTQTCVDSLGHRRIMPSRVIYYQVWDTSSPPVPIKQAGISVA